MSYISLSSLNDTNHHVQEDPLVVSYKTINYLCGTKHNDELGLNMLIFLAILLLLHMCPLALLKEGISVRFVSHLLSCGLLFPPTTRLRAATQEHCPPHE